jgi:hypothetical protein
MSRRQRRTAAEPDQRTAVRDSLRRPIEGRISQYAIERGQRARVPDALRRTIRACISEYVGIPDPSEVWHFNETDLTESAHHQLISDGGVIEAGRTGERRQWRTDPDVYAAIQRIAAEQPLLDCGHKPFRTLDTDSERPYSCLHDDCDARYTRETIEAVLR